MKYVYVLVSCDTDLYYEQALMSAFSLRMHMPQAELIVLADDRTVSSFIGNRTGLKELASEIISVPFSVETKNIERSRLMKTSIPDYICGDFLYIDCDTVICDDLSGIEQFPYEVAGVLDGHVLMNEHIHRNYFLERDKRLGFSGTRASGYNINGGILLARDTPYMHEFFKQWNKSWKYSAYQKHDMHDQSALNQANFLTGLKAGLLSGEWNCQPAHGGLAYLHNVKILHYYSSEIGADSYVPYYKLADNTILNRIKQSGTVSEDIKVMLKTPEFQFNKVHLVSDRRIISIMQSPLLFTLSDLKLHCYPVFAALEKTAAGIRRIGRAIKHKKW